APGSPHPAARRPGQAPARPPIWISMVAPSGDIVPLHPYTRYEDRTGYVASADRPDEADAELVAGFTGLDYPGAMLPVGLGLMMGWLFLIARAWLNPYTRLFWKGGSLLTLPDLFYRNIILGSQVLLAVPIACAVWTHAEARHFASAPGMAILATAIFLFAALALGMLKPLCRRGLGTVLRGRPLAGESGQLPKNPPASSLETATSITVNQGL